MKNVSLLIAFCLLFSLSARAQSTTTVENNTNRITITTTKVDENGKTITETWIAEGNEPAKLLEEMAVNPEIIKKVEIDDASKNAEGERLFLFRSAGDNEEIEGTLNENADPLNNNKDANHEVIIITKKDEGIGDNPNREISSWSGQGEHTKAYAYVHVGERKSNCAALGVWANGGAETEGATINGLIDKGGAQEAGLLEGDVIKKINEYVITDFASLYSAISNFLPGDQVTVRYERSGKALKAKVLLKDWAELPGHEWRARGDCGKSDPPADIVKNQPDVDHPYGTGIQPLVLEDVKIYPNPTDGVFALSFTTAPGPLTVMINDVDGKVVFQENNDNTSGSYNRDIDLKDLPQGNYVISVKQGEKVYTQQISKH